MAQVSSLRVRIRARTASGQKLLRWVLPKNLHGGAPGEAADLYPEWRLIVAQWPAPGACCRTPRAALTLAAAGTARRPWRHARGLVSDLISLKRS